MDGSFSLPRAWRQKFWDQPEDLWLEVIRDAPNQKHKDQVRLVTRGTNAKISMPCFMANHNDSTASAAIHLKEGFANCLSGSCSMSFTSDPLLVVSQLYGVGYAQAAQVLSTKFKLELPKKLSEELKQYERMQRILDGFHRAAQETLLNVARNPTDPDHVLFVPALTYLQSRKIDIPTAVSHGLGLFPTFRAFFSKLKPEDQPYAREAIGESIYPPGTNSVCPYTGYAVFAYETAVNQYGKFKIRNIDQNSPNYKANVWAGPDTTNNFFGLSACASVYETQSRYVGKAGFDVFIVEGEFDALMALQWQIIDRQAPLERPFFAASGGSIGDVKELLKTGASRVVLLPDNDDGGVGFVESALTAVENSDSLAIYSYSQSIVPDGYDPFDIFHNLPMEEAEDFFDTLEKESERIQLAHEWLYDQFHSEYSVLIQPTPAEVLNIIKRYARHLDEGVGSEIFLNRVSTDTGFPPESIRSHTITVAEDERGFRMILQNRLLEVFEPLLQGDGGLQCYSRQHKLTFSLPVHSPLDCEMALAAHVLRMPLTQWIETKIGIPEFITTKRTARGVDDRPWSEVTRVLREHVFAVVTEQIAATTPVQENVRVIKQGVHALRPKGFTQHSTDGTTFVHAHIINGHLHFRALIEPGADHPVQWEAFDDAKPYEDSVFLVGAEPSWSEAIVSEMNLNQTIPMERGQKAYTDIVEYFRHGWTFEEQETVSELLAATVMILIIHQFSNSCPMFHLLGETQCGKSTLSMGTFRGTGEEYEKRIWLTEHVTGDDAYTTASAWQSMDGCGKFFVFDEFEDQDDGRTSNRKMHVMQILEVLRNISGGMVLKRGGRTGKPKSYYLRTGLMTAATNPIRREVDANRFFTVNMVRQKVPAYIKVTRKFSNAKVRDMRTTASLFPLQHLNGILGAYHKLKTTLPTEIEVTEMRLLQRITLPLAFVSYIGGDYIDLAQRAVNLHERTLRRTVQSDDQSLFDAIFNTRAVDIGDRMGRLHSLRELLHDPKERLALNELNVGAYLNPAKTHVLLHLPSIHKNILFRDTVYRSTENPLTLHTKLQHHPLVQAGPDLKKDAKLRYYLSRFINTHEKAQTQLLQVAIGDIITDPDYME